MLEADDGVGAVQLLEAALDILQGVLAVQLMLDGLAEFGIITMSTDDH